MRRMKFVYLAKETKKENNGSSQVMSRNLSCLVEIAGGSSDVVVYKMPVTNLKNVALSLLHGGNYGVEPRYEREFIDICKKESPDFVFIDNSYFGSICRKLSKAGIPTVCFAHNFEVSLALQEMKSRNPLVSVPKMILMFLNERRAARYADYLICLTERDSSGYGKAFGRHADLILPITFPSNGILVGRSVNPPGRHTYLFVGSDFFPNVKGMAWFIKNVAPFVDADFRIVGSCCKNPEISAMPLPANVALVGYVDDLKPEYTGASGVIAPIFMGSGMKTKTVEAISYGKSIFGTTEAFIGIECEYGKIGALCNDAREFIDALNAHDGTLINEYTVRLYDSEYSDSSFRDRLAQFLSHAKVKKG